MRIPVLSKDPDFPYIIEVHFESAATPAATLEPTIEPISTLIQAPTFETPQGTITFSDQRPTYILEPEIPHKKRFVPVLIVAISIELVILGVVAWRFLIKPSEKVAEIPAAEIVPVENQKIYQEEQPKTEKPAAIVEEKPAEPQPPLVDQRPKNLDAAFDEFRDYVASTGLDMSFGYMDLTTGYTYKYQGDRIYYGASLVKTLDAMYAYEKLGTFDWNTNALIINAITYSKNEAHASLVEKLGIENLREYSKEIGMEHHLKPSSIYSGTYYFCDTTVDDQLKEWKHLWYLVNNLEMGWELGEHFRIGWWGVLQFPGHPDFMFKAGFYGPYYNETGIFLTEKPYIFTLLTTNGYRADKDYYMSDLSRRIYEINQSY